MMMIKECEDVIWKSSIKPAQNTACETTKCGKFLKIVNFFLLIRINSMTAYKEFSFQESWFYLTNILKILNVGIPKENITLPLGVQNVKKVFIKRKKQKKNIST